MAILFVTSGLESGRDGVGDYTRLLAGECTRQNHPCALLALNDPAVSEPVEGLDATSGTPIPALRLPARLDWETRVKLALNFRSRHDIDWISLQFVSYGFHPKGIVGQLTRYLEPLMAGCPVHVMFHEIWIGIGPTPGLKKNLVGYFQRRSIQGLLRQLRPRVITTTNPFYRMLLDLAGIPTTELPLFGNIPVMPVAGNIPAALHQASLCDAFGTHPDRWLGLFFGTLHPEWKAEPFMSILIAAAAQARRRPILISAGRLGESGGALWQELRLRYGDEVDFLALGEIPAPQVSALMQIADFGLASSPWYLLGKSGSAAAMLDHGLPVIVTRDDFRPAVSEIKEPLFHPCDATLEAKLATGLPRGTVRHSLTDRARDFLHLLK